MTSCYYLLKMYHFSITVNALLVRYDYQKCSKRLYLKFFTLYKFYWPDDGLNTLKYKVLTRISDSVYEKITVDFNFETIEDLRMLNAHVNTTELITGFAKAHYRITVLKSLLDKIEH